MQRIKIEQGTQYVQHLASGGRQQLTAQRTRETDAELRDGRFYFTSGNGAQFSVAQHDAVLLRDPSPY